MEIIEYITENALILIPALVVIGSVLKGISIIPNKYIPLILLPLGVLGAMALNGISAANCVQGILVTGAAVYGHQIYKQLIVKTE